MNVEDGELTSITCTSPAHVLMTYFVEDFQRRLKVVSRGGRKPHVMKTRYNMLLSEETANIQE